MSPSTNAQLAELQRRLDAARAMMLGYPVPTFDYHDLAPFFAYFLNNIGDPYVVSSFASHTKEMEQEVIAFFARLLGTDVSSVWGYVTTGGTEGNLYGLYMGRTQYPDACVYYSAASHYSIPKNIDVLGMQGVIVQATSRGEMDYADLGRQLARRQATQAIAVANIGTTMTEAKDNITTIRQTLSALGVNKSHIHVDGALAGVYTTLVQPQHPYSFAHGADSVSISGYKFIGGPFPSGVALIKKQLQQRAAQLIPYIETTDTTLSGSRNGHNVLLLWYALQKLGTEGLRARALDAMAIAEYTLLRLQQIGWKAWRNPGALTVVIKAPPKKFASHWQLATDGEWSHIVCVPGITRQKIDAFIADLTAYAV